jgi:hypothetical protein
LIAQLAAYVIREDGEYRFAVVPRRTAAGLNEVLHVSRSGIGEVRHLGKIA